MAVDYIRWIEKAIDESDTLTRQGLAAHLGRDPSMITTVLQGRRSLKADDIDVIEDYLGVLRPSRLWLPVIGRVSSGWYPTGSYRDTGQLVAPVLSRFKERQVAFRLDDAVGGFPERSTIIATPVDRRRRFSSDQTIVVRHEKADLENLTLAKGDVSEGTPIALVIEIRVPL